MVVFMKQLRDNSCRDCRHLYREGREDYRSWWSCSYSFSSMFHYTHRHTSRHLSIERNSLKSVSSPLLLHIQDRWKAVHLSSSAVLQGPFHIADIRTHKRALLNLIKKTKKSNYYLNCIHSVVSHNNSSVLLCQPQEDLPPPQNQPLLMRNIELQMVTKKKTDLFLRFSQISKDFKGAYLQAHKHSRQTNSSLQMF